MVTLTTEDLKRLSQSEFIALLEKEIEVAMEAIAYSDADTCCGPVESQNAGNAFRESLAVFAEAVRRLREGA